MRSRDCRRSTDLAYPSRLPQPDDQGKTHVGELVNLILLGVIEGVTEFLPISSTGHLLIAEHWLGHRSEVFNVVIQAGAILAVVLIYWRRLWELATGLGDPKNRDYALKLAVAYDRVLRKGCAIAMLKRLASLSNNPKWTSEANRNIDSIDANAQWFKGYRKEAMAAVGR